MELYMVKMVNKLRRGVDFVRNDLWRTTTEELDHSRRFGVQVLKTLVISARGFSENDISMRANSLTYSFMFAVVPIMSLFLAVARGFGFEQVIESYLKKSFLGQYDEKLIDVIMGFVQRYLETAQGGVFLGVGILILLWAVYSFFVNVESSFNRIWQVQKSRNPVRQMTSYIMILLSIPLMMIVSSGISILVNTKLGDAQFIDMSAFREFLIKLIPWATMWLVFVLMYKGIPNTKVRWNAAIIPGVLIGTLAQLLQMLGVYIFMFLGRTSIVYGAFAIVPLLLTWVQWLSLLILFGAELSYSIQNNEHFDYQIDIDRMSRRYKDYLTLYICYCIVKRFERAEKPYTVHELAQETHLPVRIINQLIGRMREVEILNKVNPAEGDREGRYQPAMDINRLTVGMLFEYIERGGSENFFRNTAEEMKPFWKRWLKLKKESYDFSNCLIKDL
ncbi:MAG: YihY/virulence factor BrkB family protein [Bacteroidales bacterium]|nr:YihY/virulence factor BrkB family protein [Bacteroidales bacterium]